METKVPSVKISNNFKIDVLNKYKNLLGYQYNLLFILVKGNYTLSYWSCRQLEKSFIRLWIAGEKKLNKKIRDVGALQFFNKLEQVGIIWTSLNSQNYLTLLNCLNSQNYMNCLNILNSQKSLNYFNCLNCLISQTIRTVWLSDMSELFECLTVWSVWTT